MLHVSDAPWGPRLTAIHRFVIREDEPVSGERLRIWRSRAQRALSMVRRSSCSAQDALIAYRQVEANSKAAAPSVAQTGLAILQPFPSGAANSCSAINVSPRAR